MSQLKDKVENALNEARILVLGVQVLLGFQFQVVFEPGFEKLTPVARAAYLAGLGLLLLTLAGLMAPAAFHRLVVRGNVTPSLLRFTTHVADLCLLPFGLGLSLDFYGLTERLGGPRFGLLAAGLALALTLLFWYGWEWLDRARAPDPLERQNPMSEKLSGASAGTPLTEKVKQVMMEARIVLPGVQALLAFQFMTFFLDAFDKLSAVLKYAHLTGLILIGLSMVLLMTPAAYHRLVERGEDSERFHRLASRLLLAAMAFFALGMAVDVWVVVEKVSGSRPAGLWSAAATLVVFYGLWFGYTYLRRTRAGVDNA
jgi:hypothetical protein